MATYKYKRGGHGSLYVPGEKIPSRHSVNTDRKVVHGKWLINCDGYYPYCSVCQSEPESRNMTKYCPNCGAKMDLK